MTTYTLTANNLEAQVTLNPVASGTHAYGIVFDEDASTVTETESRQFIGFCHWEIVYAIASDMLTTRRRIEAFEVAEAVSGILPACECGN